MLFWLGIVILVTYALIGLDAVRGSRKIRFLRDIEPIAADQAPSISLIVAARNEERNIRQALQSLLAQDYPNLQLIVVNDRSEDGTGAILEELARLDQRLAVVNITDLPEGWLGKNHALWQGALLATGELLLFTDADVVMAPQTLAKAAGYVQQKQLDHLAATPQVSMPGPVLNMFGVAFGFFFGMFTRPWKANDPRSRCHIGIGAFNLVRAKAYQQVGGHKTIALRPDDDLKLGKIIKLAGFRQELAYGTGLISVEWYASVRELILGLEKNAFAGTDYRLWLTVSGVVFHLVASIWPYLALFTTEGATWLVYAVCVLVITGIVADGARFHGASPWYGFGFPLATALFCFILVRTLILNLSQGGITWRGTFYPLDQLRKNRV